MNDVYVVQYKEDGVAFIWQIYAVTTNEEKAIEVALSISGMEGIETVGYEKVKMIKE